MIILRIVGILVWAAFLGTVVNRGWSIEGTGCYQEPLSKCCLLIEVQEILLQSLCHSLSSMFFVINDMASLKELIKCCMIMTHLKENALLELEVLSHDVGDVGRLDWEGDGNVSLLQDVVHLDMKKMMKWVKMMKMNVVGSCWGRWDICHLEVADNAAPGEPRHLNSHILCLLCEVPLAETSFVLKDQIEQSSTWATSPSSSAQSCLPKPRTLDSLGRSDSASTHSPFTFGSMEIKFKIWQNSPSWTFHWFHFPWRLAPLPPPLRWSAQRNCHSCLWSPPPDEIDVNDNEDNENKKKNIDKKEEKLWYFCWSPLSFPLCAPSPWPALSPNWWDTSFNISATTSAAATTPGINSKLWWDLHHNQQLKTCSWHWPSRRWRVDKTFGFRTGFDILQLSVLACWNDSKIWKENVPAVCASIVCQHCVPASSPEEMPPDQLFLLVCAFRKVVQRRGRRWLAACLNIIVRFHQICCTSSWSKQVEEVGWLHAWVSSSDAEITLRNYHNNLKRFVLWWWCKITSYMCTWQGQMLCVQLS